MSQNNIKNIYYPPGGILIWIILMVELVTFLLAIISLMYFRNKNLVEFNEFQLNLNVLMGTLNTIILITSGFFMAQAVEYLKENAHKVATRYIDLTIFSGLLFLVVKSIEYYHKIELGFGLSTSIFHSYYWLVTGFHYIHIILGLIILAAIRYYIAKKEYHAEDMFDVESAGIYWHMCDLIWIIIFPVFYLLN